MENKSIYEQYVEIFGNKYVEYLVVKAICDVLTGRHEKNAKH